MQDINFKKGAHIYFIGIGGVSMSGLAKILLKYSYRVSGSDMTISELTKDLEKHNVDINYEQVSENIDSSIDYVIYTAAIHSDHPEYRKAKELGIPLITRAKLLAYIMSKFESSIAVSGTHGKTSTTAMLSHILLKNECDPTISIGGNLDIINGNIRIGKENKVFITEACEYTNSFLDLKPSVGIILNVEEDHLDFFKDLADIRLSFKKFIDRIDDNGTIVINANIKEYKNLIDNFSGKIITACNESADVYAKEIEYDEFAYSSFLLVAFGKEYGRIKLKAPGAHNIENALCAIATALSLGIEFNIIKDALETFVGAKRRFELKGVLGNNIKIVDDYAHHPQEIEASLKAARKIKINKLLCIFQPHTYTRTKFLLKEFAQALSLADIIVLAKIYPARETDTLGISSLDIAKILEEKGKEVYYIDNFEDIERFVLKKLSTNDMCITMGAGDVVKIGESLLGI